MQACDIADPGATDAGAPQPGIAADTDVSGAPCPADGEELIAALEAQVSEFLAAPSFESPASRWRRVSYSCYVAWELRFRTATWQRAESTVSNTVHANLFGWSSEDAIPGRYASAAGADVVTNTAVPLRPEDRNLQDDLRGAAQAYRAAREARLEVDSGGGAIAARALASTVRDVVAWRCVRVSGAHSEEGFLATLDVAFDGAVTNYHEKDLKSQLLHSFHNVIGFGPNTFKSKSSQRRRRRPRKSRSSRPGSSRSSPAPPQHVERAARAGRAPYVDPHAEQQLGGWEAHLTAAGGAGLELTGGASSSYWPHDGDQLGGASQPVYLAEQMQLTDEVAMRPMLSIWPESWQMPWPESLQMLACDVPRSRVRAARQRRDTCSVRRGHRRLRARPLGGPRSGEAL